MWNRPPARFRGLNPLPITRSVEIQYLVDQQHGSSWDRSHDHQAAVIHASPALLTQLNCVSADYTIPSSNNGPAVQYKHWPTANLRGDGCGYHLSYHHDHYNHHRPPEFQNSTSSFLSRGHPRLRHPLPWRSDSNHNRQPLYIDFADRCHITNVGGMQGSEVSPTRRHTLLITPSATGSTGSTAVTGATGINNSERDSSTQSSSAPSSHYCRSVQQAAIQDCCPMQANNTDNNSMPGEKSDSDEYATDDEGDSIQVEYASGPSRQCETGVAIPVATSALSSSSHSNDSNTASQHPAFRPRTVQFNPPHLVHHRHPTYERLQNRVATNVATSPTSRKRGSDYKPPPPSSYKVRRKKKQKTANKQAPCATAINVTSDVSSRTIADNDNVSSVNLETASEEVLLALLLSKLDRRSAGDGSRVAIGMALSDVKSMIAMKLDHAVVVQPTQQGGDKKQAGLRDLQNETTDDVDMDVAPTGTEEQNQVATDPADGMISDSKCMLCDVVFTSSSQRLDHISGKKHQKRLKQLSTIGKHDASKTNFNVQRQSEVDSHRSGKTTTKTNDEDTKTVATVLATEADPQRPDNTNQFQQPSPHYCDVDMCTDVDMEPIDEHIAFQEGLQLLKIKWVVAKDHADQENMNKCAFEIFRMMEDHLRFLTRRYVGPGIDPTRMSWNELLNVLKRNTIHRLCAAFERKLDSVRQLRNSVVHSFSLSLSSETFNKVFSISQELMVWGKGFRCVEQGVNYNVRHTK